jgi:hypothetical protein
MKGEATQMQRREALIKIMKDALENTKARHPNCRGPFVIVFPEDETRHTLAHKGETG